MKLLYCKDCGDVVVLRLGYDRTCECGQVVGQYTDNLNAVYSGDQAVPLGFANDSFVYARSNQPENGLGERFDAFVIPVECRTFIKANS